MALSNKENILQEEDPYEALERVFGAEDVRSPYQKSARMRAEASVHEATFMDVLGVPEAEVGNLPYRHCFTVVTYDAVAAVAKDTAIFSSAHQEMFMGPVMGRNILMMDDPEHLRYRHVVTKAFSPKTLEHWEQDVILPVINACIDEFAGTGSADLLNRFMRQFPVRVISTLLGLPVEKADQFHAEANWLIEFSGASGARHGRVTVVARVHGRAHSRPT